MLEWRRQGKVSKAEVRVLAIGHTQEPTSSTPTFPLLLLLQIIPTQNNTGQEPAVVSASVNNGGPHENLGSCMLACNHTPMLDWAQQPTCCMDPCAPLRAGLQATPSVPDRP